MAEKHTGTCFCGAVGVEVTGAPEGMGYCHCSSCRSWSGGPVNAFTLWKPENVKVTKGSQFVGHFKNDQSPDTWADRRIRGNDSEPQVRAGRSRELFGNRAADEGRPAEVEGLPGGARWFGHCGTRITDSYGVHIYGDLFRPQSLASIRFDAGETGTSVEFAAVTAGAAFGLLTSKRCRAAAASGVAPGIDRQFHISNHRLV
jgi:hypothetical protein